MTDSPRVVVTGVGVISVAGTGREGHWEGLLKPQHPGLRVIHDFDPAPLFDSPKEPRRIDRMHQLAIAAAELARTDAGHPEPDPARAGVVIGSGAGGVGTLQDAVTALIKGGTRKVSPFTVPGMLANLAAGRVSMRFGWQGPCEATGTACAAGADAIGYGLDLIRSGRCDVVVAGGAESPLSDTVLAGFERSTGTSSDGLCRPFDRDRTGMVMGEGAAVLMLESAESAAERGARVLAELLGYGSTTDAYNIVAPHPQAVASIRSMRRALTDAELEPSDIRWVHAHATATPLNDPRESIAIAEVFGEPGPPVTCTKGVTGHSLGASGAMGAAAVVQSFQTGLIPPTDGFENLDPECRPIDVVAGEPRPFEPGPVMTNAFALGGHNSILIFGPAT